VKVDAESRCNFSRKMWLWPWQSLRSEDSLIILLMSSEPIQLTLNPLDLRWGIGKRIESVRMKKTRFTTVLPHLKLKSMANYWERSKRVRIIRSP
jgi:hypothetical protein